MQEIIDFIRSDYYLIGISLLLVFLFISFLILLVNNIKMNKKYNNFMKKLGNGKNIEEDIEKFICKVNNVEKQNLDIMDFCKNLNNNMSKCIQKVGIVRYSAFRDTGSDLSFAVALLDEDNSGIVFNGIYSREISNIYAKPVNNGNSKYTLSEEEIEAIKKAIN